MSQPDVPFEPPFVGQERIELVDWLVDLYDGVAASAVPVWVSIEAPSGWGKTRVVQEFYTRLAAERQGDPPYWPPSILDGTVGGAVGRRKCVRYDTVEHAPHSIPLWAWIGTSCAMGASGRSVNTLRTDLLQLEGHAPFLEMRWRQCVGVGKRVGERLKNEADTAVGLAAEGAGMVIPFFGFFRIAAEKIAGGVSEGSQRKSLLSSRASIHASGSAERNEQFVAEYAEGISRIAVPGLPVVIVVEDVHDADVMLVEFLRRLIVAEGAAVMVITTSWPGHLTTSTNLGPLAELFGSQSDRAHSVVAGTTPTGDTGNLVGVSDLPVSDTKTIVETLLPAADESTAELLAEHFTSPFALEIYCDTLRKQHPVDQGPLILTPEQVREVPTTVKGQMKEMWNRLDADVRLSLALAALSSPTGINPEWSDGDDSWHNKAVIEALLASGVIQGEIEDAITDLDAEQTAYGWARAVEDWLRRFIEPTQREIALEYANDPQKLLDSTKQKFWELLANKFHEQGEGTEVPEHRARMILALHAEGFIATGPSVAKAALTLLGSGNFRRPEERLTLAETGLAAVPLESETELALSIRLHRASAFGEVGQVHEAINQYRALLEDRSRVLGPDHPDTLVTRSNLASWLERRDGGHQQPA